jgi:hypothetical protein
MIQITDIKRAVTVTPHYPDRGSDMSSAEVLFSVALTSDERVDYSSVVGQMENALRECGGPNSVISKMPYAGCLVGGGAYAFKYNVSKGQNMDKTQDTPDPIVGQEHKPEKLEWKVETKGLYSVRLMVDGAELHHRRAATLWGLRRAKKCLLAAHRESGPVPPMKFKQKPGWTSVLSVIVCNVLMICGMAWIIDVLFRIFGILQ